MLQHTLSAGVCPQVMKDVRELCCEMAATRPEEDQERLKSHLEEELFHPSRPLSPTLNASASQVSICSTSSLGTADGGKEKEGEYDLPYICMMDLSVDSLTPMKFQRTPQHSIIFDAHQDTVKVSMATR